MTAYPVTMPQEEFITKVLADSDWRNFAVDSRQVKSGTIFFALPGKHSDGHYYISQAMSAGAGAVVLYDSWFHSHKQALSTEAEDYGVVLVPVSNSLKCLQAAAAAVLAQSDVKKIGITGSNGKTSTKDLLVAVLSTVASVHYAEGNLNSDIGLPLVIARIPENVDYTVLEMAISEPGEMKTLVELVLPHYALLTNIGTAHIGNLGSIEAIAEEKFRIFSNMDQDNMAIIPETDYEAMRYLEEHSLHCQVLLYGLSEKFGFSLLSENQRGSTFTYEGEEYHIPFWGEHHLHNATGIITLTRALGLSPEQINEGLASFRLPGGRGNIVRGRSILIDDSYNANPDSMKAAFATSRALANWEKRKLIFILGDMKELGAMSPEAHEEVITMAIGSGPELILLLGKDFSAAAERLPQGSESTVHGFQGIEELRDWLRAEVCAGAVFLVKASRSMELERIIPDLPGFEEIYA